jgi:MFS transporter, MHS family, shikimate and dehydroshikimate transport protein
VRPSMLKAATAGTVGALLEWYDFYIFATASALVFGQLFFPGSDKMAGTMASFGVFAAGFVSRPIGGFLFGHIGDTIGRRTSLLLTVGVIGVGTFLIGVLPTYQTLGLWAPALLTLLRVLQGIGLGGEYAGASLITIEHAPRRERGFWGSLPQAASPAGLLLAAGVFGLVSLLPQEKFLAWGWRIPFLLSAIVAFLGLFVRLQVKETPDFNKAKQQKDGKQQGGQQKKDSAPGSELLREHWWTALLAIGARLVETVSGNMIKSFGLTYVTLQLKLPNEIGLTALTVAAGIAVVATPFYGSLGDKLGQQRVYLFGCVMVALMAVPFFLLLDMRTGPAVWIAFTAAYTLGPILLLSVQPTLFTQMFHAGVRYTGLSVAYQVSAIVGGFTPLVSLWLLRQSDGSPWLVAGLLIVVALISLVSVVAATGIGTVGRLAPQPRPAGSTGT